MTDETPKASAWSRLRAQLTPANLRDASGVAGIGLIGAGVWQIYHPAGLIALGGMLLAGAVISARAAK